MKCLTTNILQKKCLFSHSLIYIIYIKVVRCQVIYMILIILHMVNKTPDQQSAVNKEMCRKDYTLKLKLSPMSFVRVVA